MLPGDRPPNAFLERRPRTQAPKNENQRDITGAQILVKDENDGWSIEDCNATGGHQAGQSKFKIQPDELFDAEVEDLLWTVDTNKDFRIVQFRVYQE